MRKLISVFLCVLTLCIGGCATLPEPTSSNNTTTETTEEEAPVYLELHFGNGEVLRKEIDHLLVPQSSGGVDSSFFIYSVSYFGDPTWLQTPMWIYFTDKIASYITAVFPDGSKYSLNGIKSTDVDLDSRTLIAYLWRDEPYQTEREYFEVVKEEE